jgi:hypothetical protein
MYMLSFFKNGKKSRPRSGRLFRLSSPRRETGAVPQVDVHVKMNPVMSVTYIDFMYSAVHLYSTHTHTRLMRAHGLISFPCYY